jgi:hypothetical protein
VLYFNSTAAPLVDQPTTISAKLTTPKIKKQTFFIFVLLPPTLGTILIFPVRSRYFVPAPASLEIILKKISF